MANIIPHALTPGTPDDAALKKLFQQYKRESFDQRHLFERQWTRAIYYYMGRHWIYYDNYHGEWRDKRIAKWIPRPVTPKVVEGVETIRTMFTATRIGANIRPNGNLPKNVVAAGVADEYEPILRDVHDMDRVFNEFDFWLTLCGTAFLHTCLDRSYDYGRVDNPVEQCVACGAQYPSDQIAAAGNACPDCGARQFQPALDEQGQPMVNHMPQSQGITVALSPLEIAFPTQYARWSDLPYIIRLGWRDKHYYENHAELKDYIDKINWSKSPTSRSMQLFKSLPMQSDLTTNAYGNTLGGGSADGEGVPEYDIYIKPNDDYPDGFVFRVVGDQDPLVLHVESEQLPGPLPYHDAKGNPLFTFTHATFRKVAGRIWGVGAIDPVYKNVESLNQINSMIEMQAQRMGNPVWIYPKGVEIEKITGEPGLHLKYNAQLSNGAEPKRVDGLPINASFVQYAEKLESTIEQGMGTLDVLKGIQPGSIRSFSGIQFIDERARGRFTDVLTARGQAYRDWLRFALEIEREYGPEERIKATMQNSKGWAMETFKKADLGGDYTVIIEDGTTTPKTSLGRRAAIEHANQLQLLNVQDTDERYELLTELGLTRLVPGLDIQVQGALQDQEAFMTFIQDPQAVQQAQTQADMEQQQALAAGHPPPVPKIGPLVLKKWHDPKVRRNEFLKWVNGDEMRELLTQYPQAEGLLEAYLATVDMALMQEAQGMLDVGGEILTPPPAPGKPGPQGQPPQPAGAARAMQNSNQNSAGMRNTSGSGPEAT